MVGRYGVDQLSNLMLIVSMVLLVISLFFSGTVANYVLWGFALIFLILSYVRILSKNTSARYAENQRYMRIRSSVAGWFRVQKQRIKESRTHRFYKCPGCHQLVRVPRGKGKIRITCPKCHTAFIKKT